MRNKNGTSIGTLSKMFTNLQSEMTHWKEQKQSWLNKKGEWRQDWCASSQSPFSAHRLLSLLMDIRLNSNLQRPVYLPPERHHHSTNFHHQILILWAIVQYLWIALTHPAFSWCAPSNPKSLFPSISFWPAIVHIYQHDLYYPFSIVNDKDGVWLSIQTQSNRLAKPNNIECTHFIHHYKTNSFL